MVIPARAGIYDISHWIPAFAGMTNGGDKRIMSDTNDTVARIADTLILDEVTLGVPNGNSLMLSVQAADLEDHAVQGMVKIMDLVQFDLAGFLERNRRCLHGAERRGGLGAVDLVRGRDLAEIG